MNDVFYSPKEQQQYDFLQQITNIKPDRNEYDLLFQVLLEVHGLRLDIDISELSLMGHKVFNVAQGFLLACFADEVNLELVKAMAQYSSSYLVLKNTSILDDSLLSNIKQYIKGVSNCQLLVL